MEIMDFDSVSNKAKIRSSETRPSALHRSPVQHTEYLEVNHSLSLVSQIKCMASPCSNTACVAKDLEQADCNIFWAGLSLLVILALTSIQAISMGSKRKL